MNCGIESSFIASLLKTLRVCLAPEAVEAGHRRYRRTFTLPESTILIKSTTSASFQANSITVPSYKSLLYNFPYSIWLKYTSLRSESDRLICSGGRLVPEVGSVCSASHFSTTLHLVLVVRTVPTAPIPSSRS